MAENLEVVRSYDHSPGLRKKTDARWGDEARDGGAVTGQVG